MTNISTFVNYGSWKIVFEPEVETWSDFQLQTFAQDQTDGAAACAMDLAISVDKRWGQRYVYYFFNSRKASGMAPLKGMWAPLPIGIVFQGGEKSSGNGGWPIFV